MCDVLCGPHSDWRWFPDVEQFPDGSRRGAPPGGHDRQGRASAEPWHTLVQGRGPQGRQGNPPGGRRPATHHARVLQGEPHFRSYLVISGLSMG